MSPFWKKVAAVAFLAFLPLWAAGVVRGVVLSPEPRPGEWDIVPLAGPDSSSRQQVANNLRAIGMAHMPLPLVLEQPDVERIRVHEKSAQLATGTAEFDDDAASVRAALSAHHAMILNERNSGIAPARRLVLEVGVHPDQFDALVEKLRQVGSLESVSVQQRDRTAEFRRLHAQRQSLRKHLEAVQKLRGGKNPSIEDELKVEQRVQDIEKELQALAAQLGDFLGKESYYHVYLTLAEHEPGGVAGAAHTLPRRIGHSFLWSAAWWLVGAAAVATVAGAYVSVQVLRGRFPATVAPRAPEAPAT
jgi:hypothetical protein